MNFRVGSPIKFPATTPWIHTALILSVASGCQTNPKTVPDLHYGMTRDVVDDAVWGNDEHQFSADIDGTVYDGYRVDFGKQRAGAWYYFVFKDGEFVSAVGITQFFETEVVGKTERQVPWDSEDRMRRIIAAKPIPLDELRIEVANKLDKRRKSRSFHSNLGPAIPFLMPLFIGIAAREVPKTIRWKKRFNSARVSLGKTSEEVEEIYGSPVFVVPNSMGETRAYGPGETLGESRGQIRLGPYYAEYWIAVVFENGKSNTRVFRKPLRLRRHRPKRVSRYRIDGSPIRMFLECASLFALLPSGLARGAKSRPSSHAKQASLRESGGKPPHSIALIQSPKKCIGLCAPLARRSIIASAILIRYSCRRSKSSS